MLLLNQDPTIPSYESFPVFRDERSVQSFGFPPSRVVSKRTLISCLALLILAGVIYNGQQQQEQEQQQSPATTNTDTSLDTNHVPLWGASLVSSHQNDDDDDDDAFHGMKWHNPPKVFIEDDDGNRLSFTVPKHTDYWRITFHDGFIQDDAPFYYRKVKGDFEATVKFTGNFTSLYDQAGLMVRASKKVWMKCGVEYTTDHIQHASTVITREYSDWSILPLPSNPETIWFKAKRTKECIETFYSLDGQTYTQIRQGYLTDQDNLEVGIMAAAPKGDGFDVVFEDFEILS